MYTWHVMFNYVKKWARNFLVRTQKFTGTDNVYAARHGFWTVSGYLFGSAIGLVSVWVYANYIPKELYGTYKYIIALYAGFGFLTLTGMNTAVTQAVAKGQYGILRYAVKVQLMWNLPYALVGIGLAGWYFAHGNPIFGYSLLVLALSSPIALALNTYGAFLAGRKEFKIATIYGTISNICSSAATLAAFIFSRNIIVWILAYAFGTLIPMTFFYVLTLKRGAFNEPTQQEKTDLLRFTGHLSFVNILSQIAGYLDKILLFQYVGPVAVATYAFASVGTDRLKGLAKNATSILAPRLTERSLREIDGVFYKRTFQAMGIGLVMSLGYIIVVPFVFTYLFPKYMEAVRYSQVLSLSMIGIMAGGYAGSVFDAHKMLRAIYPSTLGVRILQIVLIASLGYVWGIWGMITATLATQFAGIISTFVLWEIAMHRQGLR